MLLWMKYLADCKAIGKTPDKPFSEQLNLRSSPELNPPITMEAKKKNISLKAFVELSLD